MLPHLNIFDQFQRDTKITTMNFSDYVRFFAQAYISFKIHNYC